MAIECKFEVFSVSKHKGCSVLTMKPVCNDGRDLAKMCAENKKYWSATPAGHLEITVTTDAGREEIDKMEVGDEYFIQIRKARK